MTDPMSSNWAQPEGTPPAPVGGPVPAGPPGYQPAPVPAPVSAPPVKPKRKGNLTNIVLGVAVVVAIGGVAFAAGRVTAPAAATARAGRTAGTGQGFQGGPTGSFDPAAGQGGAGGFGNRELTLIGTVASVDGSTMTLTTQGGQTVTIDLSQTTYHAQAPASASDVTTGATVQVSVTGFGGFRPDASPGTATNGGSRTISATDVTVVPK